MAKGQAARARRPDRADRRRSARTEFVVRVDYSTVDQLFSDFATNINEGGLFVETDRPHPVDTEVSLHFRIPGDGEPIRVHGKVVWTRGSGRGEPPGMGIEFGELDPPSRRRVDELVRCLRNDARGAAPEGAH